MRAKFIELMKTTNQVVKASEGIPKGIVSTSSQPWAEGLNPVGIQGTPGLVSEAPYKSRANVQTST